jgi:hypothetical protein
VVKKAKYSSQLTKEDHMVINHIILMCATSFVMMLTRFHNPKELGNYWYRKYKSRFELAFCYLFFDINSGFKQLVGSTQLNKKIASALAVCDLNERDNTSAVSLKGKKLQPGTYLHPRDMSKLLKYLEQVGVYIHIEGKKAIKKEAKSRPGKKPYNETKPTIKGRPSMYKISNDCEKFSKVLSKPEARELLNDSLTKSNLFYSYLRFTLKAFCYAIRNDKTIVEKMFKITNIDLDKSCIDFMVSLDDTALEELVDQAILSAIGKHVSFDDKFFLAGMINPKLPGKHVA